MGYTITDWAQAEGALYMGAGGPMEFGWTAIAAVLCLVALISGSAHEKSAYRRISVAGR